MRKHHVAGSTAALCILIQGACGSPTDAGPAAPPTGEAGALLSVEILGGTDVVGYAFAMERVACTPEESFEPWASTWTVDLVDGYFPGMIEVVEARLDPDSRHLGADLFLSLSPGCYDLVAMPAQAVDPDGWEASEDCAEARAESMEVEPGSTTEVILISQCNGA